MAKQSLVIVESPAKAKTIGKYLGKDYEVKACMGHLRDLQKSKLSVDVDNDFEPVYKPIKGKEAIISDLKKSAKAADTVYLATDPDREGEAISWHLKSLLDLPDKKTKRVTFNEITKNVVRQSIENPRDIDQNLVDAQQARRILDRLVGYQLSPLLWKKIKRGLSAGRVQSVATRMVDDREREIDIAGHKAFITHGHYYGVSMGPEGLVDEAKSRGCDIAMYGHTHRPFLDVIDGVTVLNPGSLSYPRQEGRRPSYMIIHVDADGKMDYQQKYL